MDIESRSLEELLLLQARRLKEVFEGEARSRLTPREMNLMYNCVVYATHLPAGVGGHNLMILVAKLYSNTITHDMLEDFERVEKENAAMVTNE